MYQYIISSYPFQILYNAYQYLFTNSEQLAITHSTNQISINPNLQVFYFLSLIRENDNQYTIHGLWPQTSLTKYPTFCKPVDFTMDPLYPILDKLEQYWYSKQHTLTTDEHFWKHEYQKHGSCTFTSMTEIEYFTNTINLYEEALEADLPNKYYDSDTKKCLIPVNQELKFIEN